MMPVVTYRVTGDHPSHAPVSVTLDECGMVIPLCKALKSSGYTDVIAHRIITTVERVHLD